MNILELLQPLRKITGMSAILLPFQPSGGIDWEGFERHIKRTLAAGLIPAVNMDTGYASLLEETVRIEVLQRAKSICSGHEFVAGAYVSDPESSGFGLNEYAREVEQIQKVGGLPIIFQSFGLAHQPDEEIFKNYEAIGQLTDRFLAFELSTQFAPFGRIYSLELYENLIQISQCVGAKHSSLSRAAEWERLRIRNRVRPEFMVLTGNDLAIDMVMFGSDYLLGLSTFAPEAFACRDQCWYRGDSNFYEINDTLQYLGQLAFRPPVPAYKHSAAQFLHLRKWIETSLTHPSSPSRPDSDTLILAEISKRLELQIEQVDVSQRGVR